MVDDEENICSTVDITLKRDGYEIVCANEGNQGVELFKQAFASGKPFDVILQDVHLPDISGLDLIERFQKIDPKIPIIIITAQANHQTATEAMRKGAFDYLPKPFDNETGLKPALKRAVLARKLRLTLNIADDGDYRLRIIGNTPKMKEIYDLVARIAPTNSTVLIEGESGTGKELVARSVHYQSTRLFEPFITVNCGAFSEHLLESELFGHVKGSFTSAYADKKGFLEVADKGTFFLDEISELPTTLQVKLLRVIETREFMPVGSTETRKVDVRFIAATNTNLEEQVRKGKFREDLFYRLNVIYIDLPPLRERRDDVPLLVGNFLDKYNKLMNKEVKQLSNEAMESLISRYWPGNVRELENVIQRAVALSIGNTVELNDITFGGRMIGRLEPLKSLETSQPKPAPPAFVFKEGFNLEAEVEAIEKKYIQAALEQCKWNQTAATKLLGINLRILRYKMSKYKL